MNKNFENQISKRQTFRKFGLCEYMMKSNQNHTIDKLSSPFCAIMPIMDYIVIPTNTTPTIDYI
jgi:hypothetical protein